MMELLKKLVRKFVNRTLFFFSAIRPNYIKLPEKAKDFFDDVIAGEGE